MLETLQFVLKNKRIRRMLECYILIFLCFFLFYKNGSYVFYGMIIVSYLCSIYYLVSFLYYLAPYAKKEMQDVILYEQLKLQEEHLRVLKHNQERLEELKQKANQTIMNLENNKLDKEKIYQVVDEMQLTEINYCENKVIDALLHNKLKLAKTKQIQVFTQVIAPENLQIALLDLISLFSNLLDNAIEASEKAEQAYLVLDCYPSRNYFVIKLTNSKLAKENVSLDSMKTSKQDEKNHGFGLQIIRNIVEKYDGDIQIHQEETKVEIGITIMNESVK